MAIKLGLGWKDIDIVLLGNIPTFITEISYKIINAKTNGYGRGNEPVRRSSGNKEYEVSMTLGIEEMIQIETAVQAKYGADYSPSDLAPFDIPIVIDNGETFVADVIKDFQFNEWGRQSAQGDTEINITLPGIASGINFGVPV